jgi:hypothetical protein
MAISAANHGDTGVEYRRQPRYRLAAMDWDDDED